MSVETVLPANCLVLCYPLLLLRSTVPSIRVSSNKNKQESPAGRGLGEEELDQNADDRLLGVREGNFLEGVSSRGSTNHLCPPPSPK